MKKQDIKSLLFSPDMESLIHIMKKQLESNADNYTSTYLDYTFPPYLRARIVDLFDDVYRPLFVDLLREVKAQESKSDDPKTDLVNRCRAFFVELAETFTHNGWSAVYSTPLYFPDGYDRWGPSRKQLYGLMYQSNRVLSLFVEEFDVLETLNIRCLARCIAFVDELVGKHMTVLSFHNPMGGQQHAPVKRTAELTMMTMVRNTAELLANQSRATMRYIYWTDDWTVKKGVTVRLPPTDGGQATEELGRTEYTVANPPTFIDWQEWFRLECSFEEALKNAHRPSSVALSPGHWLTRWEGLGWARDTVMLGLKSIEDYDD